MNQYVRYLKELYSMLLSSVRTKAEFTTDLMRGSSTMTESASDIAIILFSTYLYGKLSSLSIIIIYFHRFFGKINLEIRRYLDSLDKCKHLNSLDG